MPVGPASTLGLVLVGVLAATVPTSARDALQELAAEMRDSGFSEPQITSVRAGGIVTRILPQRDDRAAFVTGVARIGTPADALADEILRVEDFCSGGRTLQIGRFGVPPCLADIQPLVLERRFLDALRGCKVGDCDIKLDRHAMELTRSIDWNASDARQRAAQLTKDILLDRVRAYREQGAMAIYDDNDRPESVASAFEQILRDSPKLVRRNPAFYRYLLEFPKSVAPPNVENVFYWSKERMRKPVVSIVHMCLERRDGDGDTSYLIAMKHIYDSRYFLAYAEFLTVLPDPDSESCFLVRSIRALIDPPRGLFRGMLLGRIRGVMRNELAKDLLHTRARLESPRATAPSSRSSGPLPPN